MTNAKKKNTLPSGNCRIQVYDYTDLDGKKHYKSFTAPTKKLAKMAAAEWKAAKEQNRITPDNLTVYDAAGRYIAAKKGALSPSTIVGYEKYTPELFKRPDRHDTASGDRQRNRANMDK